MPEVIDKLRALGHDVSGLHCKSWNVFTGPDAPRMDFLITLCDTEDSQTCPDFGDKVVTGVWSLPDPAKFTGSTVERSGTAQRALCRPSPPHHDLHQFALCDARTDGAEEPGSMKSAKARSATLARNRGS